MVVGLSGHPLTPVRPAAEEGTNILEGLATTLYLFMVAGNALEKTTRRAFVASIPVQVLLSILQVAMHSLHNSFVFGLHDL